MQVEAPVARPVAHHRCEGRRLRIVPISDIFLELAIVIIGERLQR